jgi:pyridoxal phosphate enzyme (YggS family)
VAVSKTHAADVVRAAAECGLTDFGENRLEEAAPKIQAVGRPGLRWHMIGHVQGRRARDVVAAGFALIHSVDSVKLAEKLSRLALEAGRVQPVLLECNVSGEASKSGFTAHDPGSWNSRLDEFGRIAALPGLEVRGLMTMAPLGTDHETARPFFARLRAMRDAARARGLAAGWAELSMGMTDDYEGAIAEGATLLRIGRALFGERA